MPLPTQDTIHALALLGLENGRYELSFWRSQAQPAVLGTCTADGYRMWVWFYLGVLSGVVSREARPRRSSLDQLPA